MDDVKPQPIEEVRIVYVAWKLGAPMQFRIRRNGQWGQWNDHSDFKLNRAQDLEEKWICIRLGVEGAKGEPDALLRHFRIKPKDTP